MAKILILLMIFQVTFGLYLRPLVQPVTENLGPVKNCHQLGCASDACMLKSFRCDETDAPCPTMLFCSNNQIERRFGPLSCEEASCSYGYECRLKYYKSIPRARCIHEIELAHYKDPQN